MPYRQHHRTTRSQDYGRERARAHIEEASEFSDEVGNADVIVKNAFFSLSGKARAYLLDEYERLYNKTKRDYAQDTIPKWQSGQVKMSGMIAKRLFALMPPLMPTSQKHLIVEAIWKRYGPQSQKYLYLGQDSDPSAVLAAIESYFASLSVQYPIPARLERQFDWLSDNDVKIKQELLNYFMVEQRKAAMAAARLNVSMMLATMSTDVSNKISKLSHTIYVGNHRVEIKADPLRSGFALSNLPSDFVRPKTSYRWAIAFIVVVVIFGAIWLLSQYGGSTGSGRVVQAGQSESSSASGIGANAEQQGGSGPPAQVDAEEKRVPPSRPVAQPPNQAADADAFDAVPTHSPVVPTVGASKAVTVTQHLKQATITGQRNAPAVEPGQTEIPSATVAVNHDLGCSATVVADVDSSGAKVRLANGASYLISSDGIMRYSAARWSTNDAVTVCSSGSGDSAVSIANADHSDKVQAAIMATGASSNVSCMNTRVSRVSGEGSSVAVIDGASYDISPAGIMRYSAARWSTGDAVSVCRTRLSSGTVVASIANAEHLDKVQATLASTATASAVSCSSVRVVLVSADGSVVDTTDGYSYEVSSAGIMRYSAARWSTGDAIAVCKTRIADGTSSASIANQQHLDKVQATQIGKVAASAIRCGEAVVSSIGSDGSSVTLSDGRSYTVSSAGIMRYSVQRWTTGDRVSVCEALAPDGSTAASLANAERLDKVQASRT